VTRERHRAVTSESHKRYVIWDVTALGETALRLGTALVLGSAIGVERQWNQKMAGLRTNALVALGSAGFVVFSGLVGQGDPTRVAAQVVTGIGFLGAGVILRDGVNVHGLNTAATLWCSAMVGTLAGAGYVGPSPLQAAVGMAVLDVIERDGLRESVASVGTALRSALRDRKARFASIADVRGHGLFVGIEMTKIDAARTPDPDRAISVINRLKDRGFLTSNAGAYRNVVKIRPPLVFAQPHAEEFIVAFDATMAELDG
jgi:putative Mg2+ transporter-C (MgtC) family protein